MVILDRYSSHLTRDAALFARFFDAFGPDVSVAADNGGSHLLLEAFTSCLDKGYRKRLIE